MIAMEIQPPRARGPVPAKAAATISIIVPVLNEALLVEPFLRRLREFAAGAEIIVVDGGSTDSTPEIARPLCDLFLVSPRGRAHQLNAGAAVARGDIFWFLHADGEVPADSLDAIQKLMSRPETVGGYFRIRIPRAAPVYRLTDNFAHYAGKILRMRCGDHGFFCRRDAFFAAGGFPEVPVMEDVEFYRALGRLGRVTNTETRLVLNPRRYEKIGRWRITFSYGLIASMYALGFPLSLLARLYSRMCCRHGRA